MDGFKLGRPLWLLAGPNSSRVCHAPGSETGQENLGDDVVPSPVASAPGNLYFWGDLGLGGWDPGASRLFQLANWNVDVNQPGRRPEVAQWLLIWGPGPVSSAGGAIWKLGTTETMRSYGWDCPIEGLSLTSGTEVSVHSSSSHARTGGQNWKVQCSLPSVYSSCVPWIVDAAGSRFPRLHLTSGQIEE